eukprot:TRINITY_DN6554_c0_g1_i1.p1 TRINITY_DN6554_c0_g1~~TRINITY_DN6554_c0_g1_i1.p1  ORF type:complete len:379 (+),score=61.64 TRINITY_DN6554_c0_g1_i1:60-1196(+)
MKSFILFLTFALAFVALSYASLGRTRWHQLDNYDFQDYVQEYRRNYPTPAEELFRKEVFEARLNVIRKHNADPSFSWKRGVNEFSDWTEEEFRRLLGYNKVLGYATKSKSSSSNTGKVVPNPNQPSSIDWRDNGIITPVKNQGQCGSCWSFAAAESVESYWALQTGQLQELSEQQILDCTYNPDQCGGSGGCNGGTFELAWKSIANMSGLAAEWTYPYVSYWGNNNDNCPYNATLNPPQAVLSGYQDVTPNNYEATMNALTMGPLAIALDASTWSDYEEGVFNGCNQTNPDIDHGVQLVGYGHDGKYGDYWLVKNSWAPTWGEEGYIRLARSSETECGTDLYPLDGTGCINGPPNVTVCGTCGILYDPAFPIVKKPGY